MPCTQGIATIASPLPYDRVRLDVDSGQRNIEYSRPYGIGSVTDIATRPGNAGLDRRCYFSAFLIDPADGAISLVEGPDRTCTCGDEPGLRPDRYGSKNFTAGSIHCGHVVRLHSAYPDHAIAEDRVVGTGRN